MKTTIKVFGLIFGLGAVILLVFHLVMLHGLTNAMRDVILPRVKAESGIDVKVGRLSINVASGQLFLDDLEIRNPEGFLLENFASVERVSVEVDVMSLITKKPYHFKHVEVENALVNIIRNKDGEVNVQMLQQTSALSVPPSEPQQQPEVERPLPDRRPQPGQPAPQKKPTDIPEMIFDKLMADATVRYVDFKLNQLDISLKLKVRALGISTLREEDTPWGKAGIIGSLGNDKASFMTDLKLILAPITNPEELSFDLSGKILEIDPRLMGDIYDSLNVTSDPFGIDPELHVRFGRFQQSNLGINIRNVRMEDKLSRKLGGMGAIELLRIDVPVVGTLQKPEVDAETAFKKAIGNNAGTILDALLRGAAAGEVGLDEPPASISDAAVEVLGKHVEEIGENEAVKKVLKDLADGEPSATNAASPISSDTIVEILAEEIEEIGDNEALKDDLKNIGKWLFGN